MLETVMTPPIRLLAGMLEQRTGQSLSEDRHWRVEILLRPVMKRYGLAGPDALVAAIMAAPDGAMADAAMNALLNNETCFYRDSHVFRLLANEVFPAMIKHEEESGNRQRIVRLWCAGCSTGQEAYSLAIVFRNNQDRWPGWRLHIDATDVSADAIIQAKAGLYTQMEAQRGLPVNDLLHWFEPEGDKWRIDQSLRDMIDFRVENLFPASQSVRQDFARRYGMVFCRNVLLYFSAERKKQLLTLLSRSCVPGGYLFLGAGETLVGQECDFMPSLRFRGAYQRVDAGRSADMR